jgi:hypothetical protein
MARPTGLRARLTLLVAVAALCLAGAGAASATTLTAFGLDSTYKALILPDHSAPVNWELPGFDDSTWGLVQAPFGNAFGDCGFAPHNSDFPENGRVLVRKSFTLPPGSTNLHILGTVDNDAEIFVNGTSLGSVFDGFCQQNGIDFVVPDGLLVQGGTNLVAAAADDEGVITFFDMQATYDAPPPTVTPTVTGTLGTNGWYTSDVSVSWTVSDPAATTTGCDTTTVTSDTAGVTFTCSATNAAGTGSGSVTVKRDATAPELAPAVTPNPVLQGAAASADAGATDNLSGVASSSCDPVSTATLGPGSVSCSATDDAGNSASGSASYLVYAGSRGGSFVVGDGSASGAVTFWGAQWAKLNSLSLGAAPDAFKGFTASAAVCGGTWTTGPGNSPAPPAGPLPSYIAVIVASKATKSGSTITGTRAHVVVVKTNGGYDGNPGHAGTGTVVATIC